MRRRRGVRTALAAVVIVAVSVFIAAAVWYQIEERGSPGAATVVTVADGSSVGSVTSALVRQHVVGSSLAFRVYLTLHGTPIVQPGSYLMHRHDSFSDVRALLARGPNVFAVNVLPGFTIDEVATTMQHEVREEHLSQPCVAGLPQQLAHRTDRRRGRSQRRHLHHRGTQRRAQGE